MNLQHPSLHGDFIAVFRERIHHKAVPMEDGLIDCGFFFRAAIPHAVTSAVREPRGLPIRSFKGISHSVVKGTGDKRISRLYMAKGFDGDGRVPVELILPKVVKQVLGLFDPLDVPDQVAIKTTRLRSEIGEGSIHD